MQWLTIRGAPSPPGNTRNTVGPPASVLPGSHPHSLVSVSQQDLVLLRSGLQ
jgi:hypothetical protein